MGVEEINQGEEGSQKQCMNQAETFLGILHRNGCEIGKYVFTELLETCKEQALGWAFGK